MLVSSLLNRGIPESATRVASPLNTTVLHEGTSDINIDRLRQFLKQQVSLAKEHCAFKNAGFLGDCLLSVSMVPCHSERFDRLYDLAQALFLGGEYLRVVQMITYYDCEHYSLRFTVLLAHAYYQANMLKECVAVLEEPHLELPSSAKRALK